MSDLCTECLSYPCACDRVCGLPLSSCQNRVKELTKEVKNLRKTLDHVLGCPDLTCKRCRNNIKAALMGL